MDIRLEKLSSTQAKLTVLVPAATVGDRLDSYYSSLAKKAKIPGFRPGKAPKTIVRQHYGEDSVADVIERMVAEFTHQALDAHKLELLYPPKLLATDVPDEKRDFRFEVELDLRPQVPDIKWDGLIIDEPDVRPVTDESVEEQMKHLQETEALYLPLIEDRGIAKDDQVTLSFKGHWNGNYLPELESAGQTFVVGQRFFLPDFEEAVLGLKKGDKKTFDVTFPENYQAEKYRNQIVTFDIEVLEVKTKRLPDITDDFAKTLFADTPTLEALRERIRKELTEQHERMRKSTLRDRVGDKLVELNPFEINQRQWQTHAQRLAHEAHHMMHEMGVKHEESEEHQKALDATAMKKAQRDIQLSYLLHKIAQEQNFELKPEDIEARFAETAKKTGYSVTQIKQYYAGRDEDSSISRMERLRIDILDEKSLDYALSKATIKNKG